MSEIIKKSRRKFLGLMTSLGGLTLVMVFGTNATLFKSRKYALKKGRRRLLFGRYNLRNKNATVGVVAECNSTEAVSQATRDLRKEGYDVALRRPYHSAAALNGVSNIAGIDISGMNQIQWVNDTDISVGASVLVGELFSQVSQQGRSVPTGDCIGLTISQLLSSGGIGWTSREDGLLCDKLVEAEVVNKSGEVLNSSIDPDILTFAKGGMSEDVGIFTNFVFRTVPAHTQLRKRSYFFNSRDIKESIDILRKWFVLGENLPLKSHSNCYVQFREIEVRVQDFSNDGSGLQYADRVLLPLQPDRVENKIVDGRDVGGHFEDHPLEGTYFEKGSLGFVDGFREIQDSLRGTLKLLENPLGWDGGVRVGFRTLGGRIMNSPNGAESSVGFREKKFLGEVECYWKNQAEEEVALAFLKKIYILFSRVKLHYAGFKRSIEELPESEYFGDKTALRSQIRQKIQSN